MYVKKKILLYVFFLGNILITLGLFFKKSTVGFVWYFINSNSLVGFQKLIETNLNIFYNFFYLFLNYNIFIISGLMLIILVAFFTNFLT